MSTFLDLGLCTELNKACENVGWTKPTDIQKASIPSAIQGKDVAGHAETGSGKTGAFLLPIIQVWLTEGKPKNFALILTPTREVAVQIESEINKINKAGRLALNCLNLIGGINIVEQQCLIGLQEHHIVVGTPGRIVDHIESSNGFIKQLNHCRFCVLDEADRMLNFQFEDAWEKIKKCLPRDDSRRQMLLFSATITPQVKRVRNSLLRANQTVFVETSDSEFAIVKELRQYYITTAFENRELYLYQLIRMHLTAANATAAAATSVANGGEQQDNAANGVIVFCSTCSDTLRLCLFLKNLFIRAVALNGKMKESKRKLMLAKFIRKERDVLVSTDVAGRGLDIPHVGLVINFNVPDNVKDYQHRVGRTARAGRSGLAVTLVTHIEELEFKAIQRNLSKFDSVIKIPPYGVPEGWNPSAWPSKYQIWADEAIRLAVKELGEKAKEKAEKTQQNAVESSEVEQQFDKIANRSNKKTAPKKRRRLV